MLFFTGIDYKVLGMLIKRHKCNFISNNVLSACVNIYLKVLGRTTGYWLEFLITSMAQSPQIN